jgi:enoyl-CoA hydratase
MNKIVEYHLQDKIATITMDDDKANALSPRMTKELNAALDLAKDDEAVVILTGRPGKFSAGFDLSVMKQGPEATNNMIKAGALLAERLLSFPTPVVIACNGHALAMGALLLASVDHRIGTEGDFKIGLNEVAIGMTMPWFGIEIARARLSTMYFGRSVVNAQIYDPSGAVTAGFLDQVVSEDSLMSSALQAAEAFTSLDMQAHYATKMRVRADSLTAIRAAIEKEFS